MYFDFIFIKLSYKKANEACDKEHYKTKFVVMSIHKPGAQNSDHQVVRAAEFSMALPSTSAS